MQNDVELIHEIEAVVGKQLENFECKENEVLENITKVSAECFLGSTSFISQVEFMLRVKKKFPRSNWYIMEFFLAKIVYYFVTLCTITSIFEGII